MHERRGGAGAVEGACAGGKWVEHRSGACSYTPVRCANTLKHPHTTMQGGHTDGGGVVGRESWVSLGTGMQGCSYMYACTIC